VRCARTIGQCAIYRWRLTVVISWCPHTPHAHANSISRSPEFNLKGEKGTDTTRGNEATRQVARQSITTASLDSHTALSVSACVSQVNQPGPRGNVHPTGLCCGPTQTRLGEPQKGETEAESWPLSSIHPFRKEELVSLCTLAARVHMRVGKRIKGRDVVWCRAKSQSAHTPTHS